MKYKAPYGAVDPNAAYVDKDVPGAVAGSKVPRQAIEEAQRELDALITKSGFTPDHAVLTQVLQSVRSQKLNYKVAGGTANALTVALDPAPASLAEIVGMPVRFKAIANNTLAVTIDVGVGGAVNLRRLDGSNLAPNDLRTDEIGEAWYDGTIFRMAHLVRSDAKAAVSAPITTVKKTATGAFSFVVPDGVYSILTRGWAAGGGGGYSGFASSAPSGGASGAYGERRWAVNPGDTITGSVGAGGAGGSASPAQPGQPGGNTTIVVGGVTMTLGGGAGGLNTVGAANTVANSPTGGSFSNADWGIPGEYGHLGIRIGGGAVASGGSGAAAPLGGGEAPGGAGVPLAGQIPGGGGGATSDSLTAGGTGARGEVHFVYVTP